jgi:hypothetical protein
MTTRPASAARIERIQHAADVSLKVSFDAGAIRDWTLGLVLLKERLVDVLLVSENAGQNTLELSRSGDVRGRARGVMGGAVNRLAISDAELGHLASFYLKYVRDGFAEVDHVDVQLVDGESGREHYVTFVALQSAPLVSAAEAKKRLGLK